MDRSSGADYAAIIVADLVRQRPVNGLIGLLFIGVPLVAVGQLWLIGLVQCRQTSTRRRGRRSWSRSGPLIADLRSFPRRVFGDLNPWTVGIVVVVFVLGWLSAMSAVPFIGGGSPADAGDGCLYRLVNHGTYACVSRTTYVHAGAGVQRFACGILLAFYSLHIGAALGRWTGRRTQPGTTR